MRERKASSLDFFAGGVPAGTILQMELSKIAEMLEQHSDSFDSNGKLAELSFIGAVCQFEAFWKDSFASLINISPSLIKKLRVAGLDVRLDPEDMLHHDDDVWHSLGFLIAEKINFGSARSINTAYSTLLKVTPFSRSAQKKYDQILRDRNLLVHHGGIYTSSYIKQSLSNQSHSERVHMDSLVVDMGFVIEKVVFFEKTAQKFIANSKAAMDGLIQSKEIKMDKIGSDALFMYVWWDQ